MKPKYLILIILAVCWLGIPAVNAQTIVYIPADDRPVNLDYVVDTAKAVGVEIVTPPAIFLGSRGKGGDPDGLWGWLFEKASLADDVIVSADSLLYGNLVVSRTHNIPMTVIEDRLNNFAKLKTLSPAMRIYVHTTIMRTPQTGADGEEPLYYEKYGPSIFRISALRDRDAIKGLSRLEKNELSGLLTKVPQEVLNDWYARREKNLLATRRLIEYTKQDIFSYFLLGRDDCAPFSQSHLESRLLAAETAVLPLSKYASFPGADELGMLMLTRAINNAELRIPIVRVEYAPGTGADTVPSYEDTAVGQTIMAHIFAAGGIPLPAKQSDLVLAVNTPEDGITREADSTFNKARYRRSSAVLAADMAREITAGHRLAAADIAFANGADNAFMAALRKDGMLFKLQAYAGWNTASNTIGYAIGQGMLAGDMSSKDKNRILAVRYLDDWAYQANIREAVGNGVLYPLGGSWSYLDKLTSRLTVETDGRLRTFAAVNFPDYRLNDFKLSFPWNRMFEVKVELN
jgi:hypothetical protein